MTENEKINWDEAIVGSKWIKFEDNEEKKITIKNWKVVKVDKFDKKNIPEFQAEVVEEDGKVVDKVVQQTSDKFKASLRVILENKKNKGESVKLNVLKVKGDKTVTYLIKEIKD